MYIFFNKKIHPQLTNKLAHLYDQGEGAEHLSNHLVRFPNPLAPGSDIQIHVSWGTRLQSPGVSHWDHNLHICVNLHRIRSRERTLFLLPGRPLVRNKKTSSLKKSKEGHGLIDCVLRTADCILGGIRARPYSKEGLRLTASNWFGNTLTEDVVHK